VLKLRGYLGAEYAGNDLFGFMRLAEVVKYFDGCVANLKYARATTRKLSLLTAHLQCSLPRNDGGRQVMLH